ncbi:WD40 repeat-like protein, partial [Gyrodon lividus]
MARNAYRGIRGLPVAPLVLLGHTNSIRSVAFLSDGQQVISGADDNTVRLWSAGDGHKVETVTEQGSWVLAVAASSNGQWIATGGCQNKITIWDATTHKKVVELEGHSDWIRSLVFSTDSKKIASGSNDRTVIVWHTTIGDRLAGPLKGHTNPVHSVDFCPNGDKVATCGVLEIRVW